MDAEGTTLLWSKEFERLLHRLCAAIAASEVRPADDIIAAHRFLTQWEVGETCPSLEEVVRLIERCDAPPSGWNKFDPEAWLNQVRAVILAAREDRLSKYLGLTVDSPVK